MTTLAEAMAKWIRDHGEQSVKTEDPETVHYRFSHTQDRFVLRPKEPGKCLECDGSGEVPIPYTRGAAWCVCSACGGSGHR